MLSPKGPTRSSQILSTHIAIPFPFLSASAASTSSSPRLFFFLLNVYLIGGLPVGLSIWLPREISRSTRKLVRTLTVVAGELELNHACNLMHWSPEDFESKLQEAMKQTYQRALKAAADFGYQKESPEALVHGAVISAFLSIAQAMTDQGCV